MRHWEAMRPHVSLYADATCRKAKESGIVGACQRKTKAEFMVECLTTPFRAEIDAGAAADKAEPGARAATACTTGFTVDIRSAWHTVCRLKKPSLKRIGCRAIFQVCLKATLTASTNVLRMCGRQTWPVHTVVIRAPGDLCASDDPAWPRTCSRSFVRDMPERSR